MKPVFQTRFGKEGNCWSACLASVFEVPLEEVDQCAGNKPDGIEQTEAWLAARGLFYVELSLTKAGGLGCITAPPDGTILVAGLISARGLPHAVVARVEYVQVSGKTVAYNLMVIHDPHGMDSNFEYKLDTLFFFCPLWK